jgi:hypothetical protein
MISYLGLVGVLVLDLLLSKTFHLSNTGSHPATVFDFLLLAIKP